MILLPGAADALHDVLTILLDLDLIKSWHHRCLRRSTGPPSFLPSAYPYLPRDFKELQRKTYRTPTRTNHFILKIHIYNLSISYELIYGLAYSCNAHSVAMHWSACCSTHYRSVHARGGRPGLAGIPADAHGHRDGACGGCGGCGCSGRMPSGPR